MESHVPRAYIVITHYKYTIRCDTKMCDICAKEFESIDSVVTNCCETGLNILHMSSLYGLWLQRMPLAYRVYLFGFCNNLCYIQSNVLSVNHIEQIIQMGQSTVTPTKVSALQTHTKMYQFYCITFAVIQYVFHYKPILHRQHNSMKLQ